MELNPTTAIAEIPAPSLSLPAGHRSDHQPAVRLLILTAASVGVIVLLGWIFHVEAMKRIAPGLTSMNPATAACIEISCLVLWLLREQRPIGGWQGLAANLLPLAVLYVGLAKLVDLSTGSALCPDAMLFRSQLDYGQAYPSRMAPNVAVSFVLFAIGLLAIDRPRWPRALHPQWLVTPILCAALAALIGYAYDTSGFYAYRQFIPMALHTAACLLLLSTALILSRPDQGYLRLIPRGSPGARAFARLLSACVLVPAALGSLALYLTDHSVFAGRNGTAIATVLTIFGLSIMAFLHAVSINRIEAVRRTASLQLEDLVTQLSARNGELQIEVAERKRMELAAAHQATHDALTGLPNRLLFVDHLQQAIARGLRHGNPCALFYIDIDHFKPINDRHGHHAGDEVLRQLGRRLMNTLRDTDTVARLGGDEFAAIIDAPASGEHARKLAERLSESVREPYALTLPGSDAMLEVSIGISVGIALFPGHANDLDGLVRIADRAMYRAKVDGKMLGREINIELA